jgi:hypothetical protein
MSDMHRDGKMDSDAFFLRYQAVAVPPPVHEMLEGEIARTPVAL